MKLIHNHLDIKKQYGIWQSLFFRGIAIKYRSRKKKEENKQYHELIKKLRNEEMKEKLQIDSFEVKSKILKLQHEINILLTEELAK